MARSGETLTGLFTDGPTALTWLANWTKTQLITCFLSMQTTCLWNVVKSCILPSRRNQRESQRCPLLDCCFNISQASSAFVNEQMGKEGVNYLLSIYYYAYCLGSTKMNKSWLLCLKGNVEGKKKMSTNKCNPIVFYSPRSVARFQVLIKYECLSLIQFFSPTHSAHKSCLWSSNSFCLVLITWNPKCIPLSNQTYIYTCKYI